MKSKIKLGVSLYSYQDEFFRHDMNLEDCIEAVSDMGADGIEILPEEMIRNCYHMSDEFLAQWQSWMKKYNTVPVAIDGFCDEKGIWKKTGHKYTLEDAIAVQRGYINICKQLGCKYIRVQISDMELLRALIPYAEEADVILALEIHAPMQIRGEENVENWLSVIKETGSKHLGFIPDFGIFEVEATPIILRQCLRDGASLDILKKALEYRDQKKANGEVLDLNEMMDYFKSLGASEADLGGLVWRVYNINPVPAEDLKLIMPYVVGFHGKCWNIIYKDERAAKDKYDSDIDRMDLTKLDNPYPVKDYDDLLEESANYIDALKVIIESGWEGWINTEYEGGRHLQDITEVRGVEQTRRHHAMLRNLIEKIENGEL
jgi:hypothetical protein